MPRSAGSPTGGTWSGLRCRNSAKARGRSLSSRRNRSCPSPRRCHPRSPGPRLRPSAPPENPGGSGCRPHNTRHAGRPQGCRPRKGSPRPCIRAGTPASAARHRRSRRSGAGPPARQRGAGSSPAPVGTGSRNWQECPCAVLRLFCPRPSPAAAGPRGFLRFYRGYCGP